MKIIITSLIIFIIFTTHTHAYDLTDIAVIGVAYLTNLGFHEIGHDVVADEAGAKDNEISFFTRKNGNFYFGLSTCKDIPEESRLPYFVGGERMVDITFEYALKSYREEPKTFNKVLMFFSYTDFMLYTIYSFYIRPGNGWHDPNSIREEMGISEEMLFSFVLSKTLLNTYRIFNEDTNFTPIITVDKTSAMFRIRFDF